MIHPDVVRKLRDLHPVGRSTELARLQALQPVTARAAPDVDADQVRKALASFPSAKPPEGGSSALIHRPTSCFDCWARWFPDTSRGGACCDAPFRLRCGDHGSLKAERHFASRHRRHFSSAGTIAVNRSATRSGACPSRRNSVCGPPKGTKPLRTRPVNGFTPFPRG